jgi:hypothetical protein
MSAKRLRAFMEEHQHHVIECRTCGVQANDDVTSSSEAWKAWAALRDLDPATYHIMPPGQGRVVVVDTPTPSANERLRAFIQEHDGHTLVPVFVDRDENWPGYAIIECQTCDVQALDAEEFTS